MIEMLSVRVLLLKNRVSSGGFKKGWRLLYCIKGRYCSLPLQLMIYIYSMLVLLICKYAPFWPEVNVEALILRWMLRHWASSLFLFLFISSRSPSPNKPVVKRYRRKSLSSSAGSSSESESDKKSKSGTQK